MVDCGRCVPFMQRSVIAQKITAQRSNTVRFASSPTKLQIVPCLSGLGTNKRCSSGCDEPALAILELINRCICNEIGGRRQTDQCTNEEYEETRKLIGNPGMVNDKFAKITRLLFVEL